MKPSTLICSFESAPFVLPTPNHGVAALARVRDFHGLVTVATPILNLDEALDKQLLSDKQCKLSANEWPSEIGPWDILVETARPRRLWGSLTCIGHNRACRPLPGRSPSFPRRNRQRRKTFALHSFGQSRRGRLSKPFGLSRR